MFPVNIQPRERSNRLPMHPIQQDSLNPHAAVLSLQLQYFAIFREQAEKRNETVLSNATTAAELYAELQQRHGFNLPASQIKVAINNEFCDWNHQLKSGDTVAFIPPVAGG